MPSIQAPGAVVMVRPHRFHPNPETAADNAFQRVDAATPAAVVAQCAHDEVTEAAAHLQGAGVRVHLFDDHGDDSPDSVFPNNWFSTHGDDRMALFPMHAPSRRRERRADIVEMLKHEYHVQEVVDYSGLEHDGVFLEGTGAMVLDHLARVAYSARSARADAVALDRFCMRFGFEPFAFTTADRRGQAVYHTNVLMCVATEFAMVGLNLIDEPVQREEMRRRLERSGRAVIELETAQVEEFAANALELAGHDGRVLAISARGAQSLTRAQRQIISRSARIVPLSVPNIELAGGSVRCMLAGIHLRRRATKSGRHQAPETRWPLAT